MDDMVSLFLLGQREFSARVAEISDDQWHAATVDTEWDVAALVDHVIDEQRWLAPLVGGQSLADAGEAVEAMGPTEPDRVAAWETAAFAASTALQAASLDGAVELSRGSTPTREYLSEMIFDVTVHAWDLGQATGSSLVLPDELVGPVFAMVEPLGDLSAAFAGMFKPPVPVPDDASAVDKLVAFTGRNPN